MSGIWMRNTKVARTGRDHLLRVDRAFVGKRESADGAGARCHHTRGALDDFIHQRGDPQLRHSGWWPRCLRERPCHAAYCWPKHGLRPLPRPESSRSLRNSVSVSANASRNAVHVYGDALLHDFTQKNLYLKGTGPSPMNGAGGRMR